MSLSTGTGHLSRRLLLQAGAAAATVLALPLKAFAQDKPVVRIMGVETAALEDWTAFEDETGVKIEFTPINSDPGIFRQEVVANAAGENQDLFLMDGGIQTQLGPQGFFLPIDGAQVPGWDKMRADLKQSPLLADPQGTTYGVPAVLNADSFAYFPDLVKGSEPLSYSLLFEDEATKGKVGLENTWLTTLPMAATYLKVAKGAAIANPSNMTAEEAKTVVDFLVERKKAGQFRLLWSTYDESLDAMARKETIVSNVWEPVVKALVGRGEKVVYAKAKEGYNKWLIGAYIPSQVKDRGTEATVYKAIGGFLGGAYALQIAKLRGYSTGNPQAGLDFAKAHSSAPEEVAALEANIVKIDEKFASPEFWQNVTPDNLEAIEAEWDRFKQA